METDDIQDLQFIAHMDNIISYCKYGIFSHNDAEEFFPSHRKIANEEVQELRKKKVVAGKPLHDYANLYFNARNPMLCFLLTNGYNQLCVLSISKDVLTLDDAMCSFCNAADADARFFPLPNGIRELKSNDIYRKYWNIPDDPELSEYYKSRICAEVLIPHIVERRFIEKIYVPSDEKRAIVNAQLEEADIEIPVSIDKYLFFQ